MAKRSGTVSIDYTGAPGGEAARLVRDALNGTGEAEARQADASALRGVLNRQYGGSVGALATKMAHGQGGKDPRGAALRLIERVLDGTRGLSKKTRDRVVAVSDKRLKETKALKAQPPRKRSAPPLKPGKTYHVTMQYSGNVEVSDDDRDRTLGQEEFDFDPADSDDPLADYLSAYGFDHWSGAGEIAFSIEEAD